MALVLGTNCGFVATAPTTDPEGTNGIIDTFALGFHDTSPATATKIKEIGWWCDLYGENVNFEIAIYDHDSENNRPGNIISVSRTNSVGASDEVWKKITGLNITITPNTEYWICVQVDTTSPTSCNTNYGQITGVKENDFPNETTLSDPWGGGTTYDNYAYAFYATWEAASTTNTQINVGDTWKAADAVKINIGDAWKVVASVKINIGDAWKTIF